MLILTITFLAFVCCFVTLCILHQIRESSPKWSEIKTNVVTLVATTVITFVVTLIAPYIAQAILDAITL